MSSFNIPGASYIFHAGCDLRPLEHVNLAGAILIISGTQNLKDLRHLNLAGATLTLNTSSIDLQDLSEVDLRGAQVHLNGKVAPTSSLPPHPSSKRTTVLTVPTPVPDKAPSCSFSSSPSSLPSYKASSRTSRSSSAQWRIGRDNYSPAYSTVRTIDRYRPGSSTLKRSRSPTVTTDERARQSKPRVNTAWVHDRAPSPRSGKEVVSALVAAHRASLRTQARETYNPGTSRISRRMSLKENSKKEERIMIKDEDSDAVIVDDLIQTASDGDPERHKETGAENGTPDGEGTLLHC